MKALVTFCDQAGEEYHLYRMDHGEPYGPDGVIKGIERALAMCTAGYSADVAGVHFATQAMVETRLCPQGLWSDVAHPETRYRYVVYVTPSGRLGIEAYTLTCRDPDRRDGWDEAQTYKGGTANALKWAEEQYSIHLAPKARIRVRTAPHA